MLASHENERSKPRVKSWWYLLLIIPFLVYLKGLAPSIVFGDTGDFQTAGWLWGVAHPPGYPLYTILVGIFERLPIPAVWIQVDDFSLPAWRSNLLSGLFALGAIAALFALVNRLTRRPLAGLIAAGALAFSRVFWWHAEIAENDAMSCLFILLILLLAVRWVQEKKTVDAYLLALFLGLSISHHQAILLFFPAILYYLVIHKALIFKGKQLAICVLLFVLGFSPLLYLPMSQYKSPDGPLNFVTESEYRDILSTNPEKVYSERYTTKPPMEYFLDYLGRGIYGRQRQYTHTEEALGEDVTTTADVFGFYTGVLFIDFGLPLILAGLIGLILGSKIKPPGDVENNIYPIRNWAFILIAYIVYFLVIHIYPSGDILRAPRYNLETAGPGLMLPLEVIWAVFIGLGVAGIMGGLEKTKIRTSAGTIIFVIGIILVGLNAIGNYEIGDKSQNTIAHEYGLNALDSCPTDAALVVAGDELYVFWYLHYVHPDPETGEAGYRKEIDLTTWSGELEDLSELEDISEAMTQAIVRIAGDDPGREIDTTFFNSRFLEEPDLEAYTLARRGILFALIPEYQAFHDITQGVGGLNRTSDEIEEQTGVGAIITGLPETYRWGYWGGNAMDNDIPLPENGRWLWPPEADIQWRIGEMLNFYGLDALYNGSPESAVGYFRQMVLVEPENPDARNHLELAESEFQSLN